MYREGLDRKFQSTIDRSKFFFRSKFSIPKAAIEFFQSPGPLGMAFGEGDAAKQKSVKKGALSLNGGGKAFSE